MGVPRGWYSRGYLPHIDAGAVPQFLTWRLADSLPKEAIEQMAHELRYLSDEQRKRERARRIEAYCDAGHGECLLKDALAARIIQESLFANHTILYQLHAWVIMPNHVHALLTPTVGTGLGALMDRLKGSSSFRANRALGRQGRLWQPEYFDRMVRDEKHFEGIVRYIEWNPVKARLVPDPSHWQWSSANEAAWHRLEQIEAERRAA